jgi:hypothetical protein
MVFEEPKATTIIGSLVSDIENPGRELSLQPLHLGFKNTTQTTITEFIVSIESPGKTEGSFYFPLEFRNGAPDPRTRGVAGRTSKPLTVNIKPGETFYVCSLNITVPSLDKPVKWTIYLKDMLPIQGEIDLREGERKGLVKVKQPEQKPYSPLPNVKNYT